jgi:cephalosporin-C deacetylase-like acetyl esterase
MFDYLSYWREVNNEVANWPIACERIAREQRIEANGGSWNIDWIRFDAPRSGETWGWWATPSDQPGNGVSMLWLPGYSYGTPPPDTTCLIPGACTFCVNVHGNAPDTPYINPAGKNDYILQEIEDPLSYIYRIIALRCLIAAKITASLSEADRNRFLVAGMSQGAALAIMVAAQIDFAKLCLADMPFLADIRNTIKRSNNPTYRPLKELLRTDPEKGEYALSHLEMFDPVLHAPHLRAPVWLSAGGRDPAVSAASVEAVYESVQGVEKQYRLFPDAGHVFLPEMNKNHTEWIQHYILDSKE